MSGTCEALTRRGTKCRNRATKDGDLCAAHRRIEAEEIAAPECPICLSKILRKNNSTTTTCNHEYHASCLARWIRRGATTCPTCRASIVDDTAEPPRQPPPVQTRSPSTMIDMRHILDMVVHLSPAYDEVDPEIRELVAGVAARSPTANIIMQFLEDIRFI
jgi:hypothetical protein